MENDYLNEYAFVHVVSLNMFRGTWKERKDDSHSIIRCCLCQKVIHLALSIIMATKAICRCFLSEESNRKKCMLSESSTFFAFIIIINKHHHHQLAQLFLVGSSSPRGHVPIFAWDRGKGAVIPACPVLYSCILLGVYPAVWVKYSYILSLLILAWPVELRWLRPPFQLCCSREWCL